MTLIYEHSFNAAVLALRESKDPKAIAYVYYNPKYGQYGYFLAGEAPKDNVAICTRLWLNKKKEVRLREYAWSNDPNKSLTFASVISRREA